MTIRTPVDFVSRNKAALSLSGSRQKIAVKTHNGEKASTGRLHSYKNANYTGEKNASKASKSDVKELPLALRKRNKKFDILSELTLGKNLIQIVEQILLYLSPEELEICKVVSRGWRQYIRNLWKSAVPRKELNMLLDKRWRNYSYTRIDLSLSGYGCRNLCQLNGRSCDCLPLCGLSSGYLVFNWESTKLKGLKKLCGVNPGVSALTTFEKEQYQIKLSLNEGLTLDTGAYLSRPIYLRPQPSRTRIQYRENKLEICEDKYQLMITNKAGVIRLVTPNPGYGQPRRIDKMFASAGRIALLQEGRVYVYRLDLLVMEREPADSLLLVATRMQEMTHQQIVYCFLLPEKLITVSSGYTITMFDYWRSTTGQTD